MSAKIIVKASITVLFTVVPFYFLKETSVLCASKAQQLHHTHV